MNTLSHGSHRRGSLPVGIVSVINFAVSTAERRLPVLVFLFGCTVPFVFVGSSKPMVVFVDVTLGELGSLPTDAPFFGISAMNCEFGAFGDKCDGTISHVCGVSERLYDTIIRLSGMSGENGGTVSP